MRARKERRRVRPTAVVSYSRIIAAMANSELLSGCASNKRGCRPLGACQGHLRTASQLPACTRDRAFMPISGSVVGLENHTPTPRAEHGSIEHETSWNQKERNDGGNGGLKRAAPEVNGRAVVRLSDTRFLASDASKPWISSKRLSSQQCMLRSPEGKGRGSFSLAPTSQPGPPNVC